MRIIQITDLHIAPDGVTAFDVDTRANCLRIIAEAQKLVPDRVVITGDFCFQDPHPSVYEWIKAQLDEAGMEVELISGNHDDPRVLARVFVREWALHGQEFYYQRDWAGRSVFFLDSTVGQLSQEQLNWLRGRLEQTEGPIIVFVHHPPVLAGVPFMDLNYSLQNGEALMAILEAYGQPVNVFSGHYHVEKTISRGNVTVQITPSCFVQIDQYASDFQPDHHRIALRVITLRAKEVLSTVHYFPGQ